LKTKLYIILLLLTTNLYSETWNSTTVNNQKLLLLNDDYDEYGSKGKTLSFYTESKDKNKTLLFSLILEDSTGGCNDKSLEYGTYEIDGSTITLYSLWKRVGSIDDAPYGARVQHYKLEDSGKVKLLSSKLYIEEHTKNSDPKSGMKFLFIPPKSKEDKVLFSKYIKSIERRFKGNFIFKEDANTLIKEVHSALRRSIKARWKR